MVIEIEHVDGSVANSPADVLTGFRGVLRTNPTLTGRMAAYRMNRFYGFFLRKPVYDVQRNDIPKISEYPIPLIETLGYHSIRFIMETVLDIPFSVDDFLNFPRWLGETIRDQGLLVILIKDARFSRYRLNAVSKMFFNSVYATNSVPSATVQLSFLEYGRKSLDLVKTQFRKAKDFQIHGCVKILVDDLRSCLGRLKLVKRVKFGDSVTFDDNTGIIKLLTAREMNVLGLPSIDGASTDTVIRFFVKANVMQSRDVEGVYLGNSCYENVAKRSWDALFTGSTFSNLLELHLDCFFLDTPNFATLEYCTSIRNLYLSNCGTLSDHVLNMMHKWTHIDKLGFTNGRFSGTALTCLFANLALSELTLKGTPVNSLDVFAHATNFRLKKLHLEKIGFHSEEIDQLLYSLQLPTFICSQRRLVSVSLIDMPFLDINFVRTMRRLLQQCSWMRHIRLHMRGSFENFTPADISFMNLVDC